jgi:hypothetical protein
MPHNTLNWNWNIDAFDPYPPPNQGSVHLSHQQALQEMVHSFYAAPNEIVAPLTLEEAVNVLGGETPSPRIDDSKEVMDISKTPLSKIFKYQQPGMPLNVGSALSSMQENLEKLNIKLPNRLFDFPEIKRNGDVMVGIEIEVENMNYKPLKHELMNDTLLLQISQILSQVWDQKGDTSLKKQGVEYVTKLGLQAKDAPAALALLRVYMATFFSKAEFSYRCGTHIHVNVRDFTVEQFINMVLLYVVFENMFYSIAGGDIRYKNIFCVPLRASKSDLEELLKLIHKEKPTYQQFRQVFTHFKKYMAYNLLPAGTPMGNGYPFGTVEFRHHKAEADPQVLTRWLQMILDIHQAAQQYSFEELKNKIFNLNTVSNYLQFAESIFKELPKEISNQEIVNDMYTGSAFIKELFIISKGAE